MPSGSSTKAKFHFGPKLLNPSSLCLMRLCSPLQLLSLNFCLPLSILHRENCSFRTIKSFQKNLHFLRITIQTPANLYVWAHFLPSPPFTASHPHCSPFLFLEHIDSFLLCNWLFPQPGTFSKFSLSVTDVFATSVPEQPVTLYSSTVFYSPVGINHSLVFPIASEHHEGRNFLCVAQ